jgi:transcriptional regulator with XRE-family HTH domain
VKINGKHDIKTDGGSLSPVNETGKRLIELRTAHGFSQKEVAAKIGVNYTSYSAWEIGQYTKNGSQKRQPVELKGKHIAALAQLYGVSCDYILGRSPYTAIDGAAIAARTGLSDAALQVLEKNNGVAYATAAGDVSRLLVDYERHGKGSLLYALHKYAESFPDTVISLDMNTGRPAAGLYGTDIPLSGALLYLAVTAMDQFKADLQAEKEVSK